MWMVIQKEMMELFRDRKTLFFMIALPLLIIPIIFGGVIYFTTKAMDEAETKVLTFAVIGEKHFPALVQQLTEDEGFERIKLPEGADFEQSIKSKEVDFVVEFDNAVNKPLLEAGQSQVKLYLNDAGLNMVEKRLSSYLKELNQRKQEQAFSSLAVAQDKREALLLPVKLQKVNIAQERENWGENIGGMVPYILFLLCLQGAMFPASDLAAGEKERGTLETLLLVPLTREQLVLGKFFTVMISGIVAALITIFSFALWSILFSQGMAISLIKDIVAGIGLVDYFLMFVMLVPVASIFAAILLSMSIYARSYKEAQSYMGSMMFLVLFPIIVALMPGVSLEGVWAWVPLTNVALAIKELIKGTMDYYALLGILTSTVIIAGALLAFCVYWFKQEKVLFR